MLQAKWAAASGSQTLLVDKVRNNMGMWMVLRISVCRGGKGVEGQEGTQGWVSSPRLAAVWQLVECLLSMDAKVGCPQSEW